jgi:signal transduction histidine kinase
MRDIYTRLLFLGIIIILLSISLLTYRNLSNYIEEVRLVRHSSRVLIAVQAVLSSIKDAETGHRGYQLTRDSNYLKPYFTSVKELPGQIRKLDSLLSFNDKQSRKADTLNGLIENQFMIISQILANARGSSLYMDHYEIRLLARGKKNMDQIRLVVGRIMQEEEKTFNNRISEEVKYRNLAPIALLVYTLIALIGMTILFVRVLQALDKRRMAEERIKENVEALKQEADILEFTQKTLRNILNNSLDGIMAFKSVRDSNKEVMDFEWIMSNDIGLRLTGMSGQELMGKRLLSIMPESKNNGLFDIYLEVVASGTPKRFERLNERNGSWTNVTVVKLEDGFVVTSSDLTTQKKAERDMLIAERLSMTGKMARTIAHEVRNPLTSLNLALEQLKEEMPKDDSFKIYTDVIERNANRIEQLIDEMLNLSKPKELNLELTAIADVIQETIALTIDRMNLNQIKLEISYGDELPRILLDKEKMKIAFLNIIINAIEAMQPGKGILKIETKLKDGFEIVSMIDNGKGIAPEEIEKLFDPFYTDKQGGMGLGLTSTKNILSSHSATVEVRSALEKGTTFSIYFKLA